MLISQFSDSECKSYSYDVCSLSFFLASVADAVTNLRILHRENMTPLREMGLFLLSLGSNPRKKFLDGEEASICMFNIRPNV